MSRLSERQQFFQSHLEAAAAAGIPIRRYAAEHGISAQSLYACRRRLRESPFVRVRTVETESVSAAPLQVRFPNGIVASVGIDGGTLPSVLRALASL